jgi:RHS repeat-associated protein
VHDLFGNVIAETSGTAAGTVREYIWLPETEIAPTREAMSQVDRPLAVVNGVGTTGVAVWNVSVDHLNRPVLMTNSLTTAMWTAVWQPWGGAHSITGTATLDTRFPGQWYQSETGLHYNWHRSYDPTIGRYTQPDPLGFVDGPSVYGYAGGMPQAAVDPEGLAVPGMALFCARFPIVCAELLKCARDPSKCAKEKICPVLPPAKKLVCGQPGCGSTSMQPELAHSRMRAAEACLALRDAETALCPPTSTSGRHDPEKEPAIRQQEINKINSCKAICGSMQVYGFR